MATLPLTLPSTVSESPGPVQCVNAPAVAGTCRNDTLATTSTPCPAHAFVLPASTATAITHRDILDISGLPTIRESFEARRGVVRKA